MTNPILIKAAERYGQEAQLRQLQEECAELIVAVNHYLRKRPDRLRKLYEEIADVQIMIEQMKYFFGEVAINVTVDQKIRRLEERLNG